MTSKTGGGATLPGAGARCVWQVWVAVMLIEIGSVLLLAGPALANDPARISWPYICKTDHGRLRVEPSTEQIYQIVGTPEQRPFRVCPDRQKCLTQTVYRFAITCSDQPVAWADLVASLAEKGHSKFAVADGRLAVTTQTPSRPRTDLEPAPPGRMLSGWCSNQFGGPTQLFLRQACQEARRVLSNLGGPPIVQPPQLVVSAANQQFFALPKGFAPLRGAGARLLRPSPGSPVAAAQLSAEPAAAMTLPKVTVPEPNDRSADQTARANAQSSSAISTAWITNVHLASATVAASSDMAAENQRAAANAQTINVMVLLAGLLAATLTVVALRRRQRLDVSTGQINTTSTDSTALICVQSPTSPPRGRAAALLNHRIVHRMFAWRSQAQAVLLRHRHRVIMASRPILTPEDQAALDDLPPEARLIMTARHQLTNRIEHLRQTIAPLARSAPALHLALARDLMAGERRLAKITIASLTSQPTPAPDATTDAAVDPATVDRGGAAQKLGQNRLQRVTMDLDRLQAIIAGAITSLNRDDGPRPLPRDLPEAYLVLGVNAGVGLSTLKKLVDALRVSWHPDLATSDDDRRHRDERIKEINVAWDLIVGKRDGD